MTIENAITVEQIMSTELKTVDPEQTLGSLRNFFDSVSYHHLPVVAAGKIVGIISDRDVNRAVSPFMGTELERDSDREQLNKKASDIMTPDVITIDRDTSVDTASILLLENSISCLPIIDDDDCLEGLLTWKDILKYYVYAS